VTGTASARPPRTSAARKEALAACHTISPRFGARPGHVARPKTAGTATPSSTAQPRSTAAAIRRSVAAHDEGWWHVTWNGFDAAPPQQ
jgi:hypothetical protein